MAVMWPRSLPPDVVNDTHRSAECEVYRKFESELAEPYVVFYSKPWLGLTHKGEEIDGECDFVVAHAEHGLLAIEVKGGAIAYDPANELWTSRDRKYTTHVVKNPVTQARRSKHEIVTRLRSSPDWTPRRIRARHAVVLPHSAAPSQDLGTDMPRSLFCFAEEFRHAFDHWVRERLGSASADDRHDLPLGHDGLQALEKMLASPFQLRTPLGLALSRDDMELQTLTRQQFHILGMLEKVERAAINGAAGTGKTVLAMEEARRCAASGLKTLFVCFNRGLAASAREKLSDCPDITVTTFHELCEIICGRAGITLPSTEPNAALFEEEMPELLIQAFESRPDERFDAVIADEGQDFMPLWWLAIDPGHGPGRKRFRIFFDVNQRVYGRASSIPQDVELIEITLRQNLRNTRRIHDLVRRYYVGHEIEAIGPEGNDVRWIKSKSEDGIAKIVGDLVVRLVSQEMILPDDIAVLLPSLGFLEKNTPEQYFGAIPCARCDAAEGSGVTVDSIRRFKGLERQTVILIANDNVLSADELLYVGLSRARTQLIIVGTAEILERMKPDDP